MKVNIDVRDLTQGRYMILILSTQLTCKKIKYTDSHGQAMKILNMYKKFGKDCIIIRVLNNTLSESDKRTYND